MLHTKSEPKITSETTRNQEKDNVISCDVGFPLEDSSIDFRDNNDAGAVSLVSEWSSSSGNSFRLHYYTRLEILRHNTESSAWIVAGDDVYDVTDYVEHHPGGKYSIMKKVGGAVDCTRDLLFHSKSGQKYWKQFLIGKITKNPSKNGVPVEKEWWKFWE